MTKRPIQTTPTRISILTGAVLTSSIITATIYIGRNLDGGPEVTGFVLGVLCSLGMLGHTTGQVIGRALAHRAADLEEQEADQRWEDSLGTWRGHGSVLTVRWDQEAHLYWIQGWVSDNWNVDSEMPWTDLETLAKVIIEAELDGMIPENDEGTRLVRARLDLPGWATQGGLGVQPGEWLSRELGIYPRGSCG